MDDSQVFFSNLQAVGLGDNNQMPNAFIISWNASPNLILFNIHFKTCIKYLLSLGFRRVPKGQKRYVLFSEEDYSQKEDKRYAHKASKAR